MIDPWLDVLLSPVEQQPTRSISSGYISGSDLVRFNPFLSLVTTGLPESFYAVLSIFSNLNIVSCNSTRHGEGLVCADLDSTLGFIMATQGRYPDTIFYSLARDNWDIPNSSIDILKVDSSSIALRELITNAKDANPRGVDLMFCSDISTEKLQVCAQLVKIGGSLIIRLDKPLSEEHSRLLLSTFSRIIAYKPATVSSISYVIYLICRGRSDQVTATLIQRGEQLSGQISKLEEYRLSCLQQVLSKVDNTDLCDLHLAKMKYLGL